MYSRNTVEERDLPGEKTAMNNDIKNITYLDELIFHFLKTVNKNQRKKPDHTNSAILRSNTVKFSFPLMHEIQNRLLESSGKNLKAIIHMH